MEGNNHLPLQEEIQCDIDTPKHIEHSQSTLILLKKKNKIKKKTYGERAYQKNKECD